MAIFTRFQVDLLNIAEPNSKGFKDHLANEVIKMPDLLENSFKTKKKPKKRQANS